MTTETATRRRQFLAATVRGVPVPQGSIRSLGKGRPSVHSNADRLKPWRLAVQTAVEEAADQAEIVGHDGPVAVDLVFTMPKPVSAPKRRRTWPTKRPDLDKLVRAVLDAITASGVIRDDSQVVELTAAKAYPGERLDAMNMPGAHIRISFEEAT